MDATTPEATLLQSRGLRPTRQRVAVLGALRSVKSHPTADELHQLVGDADGAMSRATVYNTLQALCRAGLCHKVETTGHSSRYDGGMHDHVHLRDGTSGRIVDVPDDLSRRLLRSIPPSLLTEVGARLGADVSRVSIQLFGEATRRDRPK